METTLEVLTAHRGRRDINRQWPDEVKAQIVSESLRPGVTVNEVAERHGLRPTTYRPGEPLHVKGKLVLPAPEDAVEFAAMVVEKPPQMGTPEPPPGKAVSRAEIVLGPVTVRLEEGASVARIAAVDLP